jgi:hypothetical protein
MTKLKIERPTEETFALKALFKGDMFSISNSMYIKLASPPEPRLCTAVSLTTGSECDFAELTRVTYHPKVRLIIEE